MSLFWYYYNVLCCQTGVEIGLCQGSTCLHAASLGGHVHVLDQLVERVNDVDIVDDRGQTAAHVAALNGEVECLKTLYDRGSSVAPLRVFC